MSSKWQSRKFLTMVYWIHGVTALLVWDVITPEVWQYATVPVMLGYFAVNGVQKFRQRDPS